jgi:CDP-diacylglycerol--glycerol-3-phosphate 3-phosphatidyltransferase
MAGVRAALGPVVIAGEACSWNGFTLAGIVITALVSDIFDGVLARRWGCDTAGVRLFDSMADTFFYVCVAIALWIGQPQVWRHNAGLLGGLVALEVMRFGLDFAKFEKPTSYHSYLAKSWGLVMAIGVVAVFASGRASPVLSVALVLGIVCDVEGLAMSLMLPVWRKDVKTIWAAWRLRGQMLDKDDRNGLQRTNRRRAALARKTAATIGGVLMLAVCLLQSVPACAVETGEVAYAGGTAGVALDTRGVLDMTSPATLLFKFSGANGAPGQIEIPYRNIRVFEYRKEVAHHLGVLPAVAVGLVKMRERRHLFSISYTDSSEAIQVAMFEVGKRDQPALLEVLRARDPQICKPWTSKCGGAQGMR